jgi:hypothetical protein
MKISNLVNTLLLASSIAFSTQSIAQNAVVVNGTPIPLSKLDRLVKNSGQENTPEIRNKARDVLITKELISQEANKRGITKDPQVQDAIEQAKLSVLVSAVFEDWIGKDTQTSMLTGVIWGMVNEINGFIARYGEAFGDLKVIITGGDAPKFVKHLKNNVFAEPNLLLFGLNKILKINV